MDYARAGYTQEENYQADMQTVRYALDKLEEHFGLEVEEIKFLPASTWCKAIYRKRRINVGMTVIREWAYLGYCEYKTLQYLIGLKWYRGEINRRHHRILVGAKSIQATMCHEYAHLLCYETYGRTFGRGHGILFQQIVAEMYDFMFGDDFGAVDRFLKKKGKKWLGELHAWEVARKYRLGA